MPRPVVRSSIAGLTLALFASCSGAGVIGGGDAASTDARRADAAPSLDAQTTFDDAASADVAQSDAASLDAAPLSDASADDAMAPHDATAADALSAHDAAGMDALTAPDASSMDASTAPDASGMDASTPRDAAGMDAARDASAAPDAAADAATAMDALTAPDAQPDASAPDAAPVDSGSADSGVTSVTVHPHAAGITIHGSLQLTATVLGTTNNSVIWSVDGMDGGNASIGTVSPSGVYTPPLTAGAHTIAARSVQDPSKSDSARIGVTDLPGMVTHKNDPGRTGQNTQEYALVPSLVNAASFGKLFSQPIDGYAYAEPLFVPDVTINGSTHNVVFVATEHDTVYAFDADTQQAPLWTTSFLINGATTVPAQDTQETGDLIPEIGITGTPVIDLASSTLFVVAKTKEAGPTYVHRLHALDIHTGLDRANSPVVISAVVAGNGPDSVGGRVTFDPLIHLQRPALLLSGGTVYVGLGSHGDHATWHGWVIGYDATSLMQLAVWCSSPDAYQSAIWQGGAGIAADSSGAIYLETGNGVYDVDTGGRDYGDSAVRLSSVGAVLDWFTPYNETTLNSGDIDLGSSGSIVLPDGLPGAHPDLMIATGKPGLLYLIDRGNMGHKGNGSDGQIVQTIPVSPNTTNITGGIFSTPAYWNGNVYIAAISDNLKAFRLSSGLLSTTPTSMSQITYDYPGATPVVSASGSSNGIVWAIAGNGYTPTAPAVLHAYDANALTTHLYASDQAAGGRDQAGPAVKMIVPAVANGHVYIATQSELDVYGLLP
jgi:hypothetical protein